MLIAFDEHVDTGVDEEGCKEVQHPGEVFQDDGAQRDEDSSEEEGTQNTKEEHTVLVFSRHAKGGEDKRPDKDVVDSEGFLNDEACEVLLTVFFTEGIPDQNSEADTGSHPEGRPECSFFE